MVVLVRVLAVVVVVLLEVDSVLVVVAVVVIVLDCGLWVFTTSTRGINNAMINVAEQIHATADKKTCGYTVVLNPVSVIKCPTP